MYRFALVNGLSVSWSRRCIELVHRQAQRAYGPQLIPSGAQCETYTALQTDKGRLSRPLHSQGSRQLAVPLSLVVRPQLTLGSGLA
jgi:hypothetical protein